jgi:hypothetical protein
MNLRLLRDMGIGEIVGRSRQEAAKWLERNGPSRPARSVRPVRDVGDPRFFAGAAHPDVARLFAAHMPEARDQIVAAAGAACRGQFDLLGYRNLSFGDPIDWHLDPVSGRRAPLVHWSRIDPLDSAVVGDSKVIWELNRHQWLLRLAQAYRLTGDERYVHVFAHHAGEWLDANPAGIGINWTSSLEVALRLVAWCWSLCLFREASLLALSQQLRDRLVDSLDAHAEHVERFLSTYFSPNTHLTGEALGLFYAGVLLPELPRAERRRTLGAQILVDQCERQVLGDGVYFEQATGYERYTLEFYLHFLILSAQNGLRVPPAVTGGVHRMLDFLLAIRRPDGSMPQIGDADSGSLLPLAPRAQDDFRGVFAVAAALLGRADCAWAAGGATAEILWLLGPAGLAAFDALQPAPPEAPASRCFAEGGYVVMQDGWDANRHQLSFDTGPLGCPVTGGHGHADLLSVQCTVFGEPYLIDAGTFTYADPVSREFFRGTAAHSTVMVDDAPQAISTGAFRWAQRPQATLRDWQSTGDFDYADAEHTAFHRLGAVVHRRRVVFVKSKYWVIADDLTGTGEHSVDVRFQFAPIDVSLDERQQATARGRSGCGLLIRPFSNVALGARVCVGVVSPMQGWISTEYGHREPAPVLVYSAMTDLPLRIITVLVPVADQTELPLITPLFDPDRGAAPIGVTFDNGDRVWFDDVAVQFHPGPAVLAPAAPYLM